MNEQKTVPCPKCRSNALSAAVKDQTHALAHTLHHGLHHGSPMIIGASLIFAVVHGVQKSWFKCTACGHRFFKW